MGSERGAGCAAAERAGSFRRGESTCRRTPEGCAGAGECGAACGARDWGGVGDCGGALRAVGLAGVTERAGAGLADAVRGEAVRGAGLLAGAGRTAAVLAGADFAGAGLAAGAFLGLISGGRETRGGRLAASPAGRRAEERFLLVEPAPTFGERAPERAGLAEAEGSDLLRLPLERLVIVENYRVGKEKERRSAV